MKEEVVSFITTFMNDAVKKRNHPMHNLTIATIKDAKYPRLRNVVIRYFDADQKIIRFHADVRAPKVNEMIENNQVEISCYDYNSKIQLRFASVARVHHQNNMTKQIWLKTPSLGRRCYLQEFAPSQILTTDQYNNLKNFYSKTYSKEENEDGYKNFVVVECLFKEVDFLQLSIKGHKRYRITFDDKDYQQMVLAP